MKWYRQHLIKACPPITDKAWHPGEGPGHPWPSGVAFQAMKSDWEMMPNSDAWPMNGVVTPLGPLLQ